MLGDQSAAGVAAAPVTLIINQAPVLETSHEFVLTQVPCSPTLSLLRSGDSSP